MITCVFCHGKGLDPFELLSPLSKCQVCLGRGKVKVKTPSIKCAYCVGTGVQPGGVRLTCPVCGGKGVLTIREPYTSCPECKGRGYAPENRLPCLTCKGIGVMAKKAAQKEVTLA